MNYIVIYYDGTENKATVAESEYPDSMQPYIWGLEDNFTIIAVIGPVGITSEGVIRSSALRVWIDETEVEDL